MAATRQALSQAHPAKTNVLSVGLIYVLILIVSLQIWLLSASVNTSLGGHANIAWTAFYASLALFLAGAVALSYLPLPIRLPVVLERAAAFTNAALAWQADGLLEEFAMYRRGEAAEVESGVHEALGRPPRSFDEFAHDYASLFS